MPGRAAERSRSERATPPRWEEGWGVSRRAAEWGRIERGNPGWDEGWILGVLCGRWVGRG
jgi:hypothetical protein